MKNFGLTLHCIQYVYGKSVENLWITVEEIALFAVLQYKQ